MLHVTRTAATTIEDARRRQGIPPTYGVRVSTARTREGRTAVALDFAPEPGSGDAVVEQHGMRLFVADEVAERLADAEIDAKPDASGNGADATRLVVRPRA